MKKGILRRVCAMMLAFAMVASGFVYAGSVSKAAESYSGILTMNRAEGSANATAIYFMGTDTMPITGTDGSGDAWTYNVLQAVDAESGIFLNGEPMTARLLKYCTVPCRYYMSFDEVQNGDAITIKGTFTISNGNAITFREMTYTYNAETGKWSESMPADESAVMSLESGHGDAGFYAVASDSMPIVSWTEPIFPILDGKSGVWVNDVWKNVPIKRHSEDKYYVGLVDGVDGGACTAQAGDVIRFGGKYTYGGYIVEFEEITLGFNGTDWIVQKPSVDTSLTLYDAEVKNGGDSKAAFYASGFDALSPIGWTGIGFTALDEESGVFVDGTRRGGSIKKYADNKYYIEAFGEAEVGQVVTIKGTFRSSSSANDLNVKESSFVFNGSHWEEVITTPDATTTFTQIDYDYNTANNVSLFSDYEHPMVAWEKNFLAAYGENGVFLNGNKVPVPMKQYAAGKYFFALSDVGVVPVKGDELVIKGCFTAQGTSVQFAPITLTFNGGAWMTDMPAVPYTDVTVLAAEAVNVGADGNGAYWDFNLRTDAEIPGENWGTQYFDAVVEYKGNPIARTFVKRAGETVLNVFFYDSIVPDKQVGDTLVLKAGEYQAYSVSTYRPSGYGMKLTKDFALVWDGNTWVQQVNYADITLKGFNPNIQASENVWHTYLALDGVLPGEPWGMVAGVAEFFNVTLVVDGQEAVVQAKELDDNNIFLEIPYSVLPKTGNHTVVVKAGQYASNVQNIGINILEDFTFYTSDAGWTMTENAYTNVKATVETNHDNSKSPNGFIITVDKEDGVTVDSGWQSRIYPARGKALASDMGMLWFGGENGIFVNDVYQDVNVPLVKVGENVYYVGLVDVEAVAQEGDKITLKGIFVDEETGRFIEFDSYSVCWTRDMWIEDGSHIHSIIHFDAVAPDCHKIGNVEYWFCEECEGFWTDEALTQLTNSKSVILPATGSDNVVHFDAVAPGCHYIGNIEYWFCPDCEGFWEDAAFTRLTNSKSVILPATGSDNVVHVAAKAPTCKAEGNIEHWYCKDCEQFWQNKELTQLTNSKNVILGKADHKAVKVPAVAAQVGKTGLTEGSKCSVCGTVLKAQVKTPALKLAKPKASKVTKATGGKKLITVKFKKISGVTRYEIQYSLKKNMKGAKTVKVTKSKDMKAGKIVIKKLKAKKTYYVRIRTVKTVNGVTAKSSWSKVLKATKTK